MDELTILRSHVAWSNQIAALMNDVLENTNIDDSQKLESIGWLVKQLGKNPHHG